MDLVDIFTQQNCSPAVDPEFQEGSYANANNCMCSDAVTAFNGLGMDVAIGSVLSPVTGDKPTPTLSPAPSGTQSYEKTLNSAGGFTGEGTAPAGAPLVTGWSFNTAVPSYDWFLNTGAALSIEGQGLDDINLWDPRSNVGDANNSSPTIEYYQHDMPTPPVSTIGSQRYYDTLREPWLAVSADSSPAESAWHSLNNEARYWEKLRDEQLELHVAAQQKLPKESSPPRHRRLRRTPGTWTSSADEAERAADHALLLAMLYELFRRSLADRTYEGVAFETALALAGLRLGSAAESSGSLLSTTRSAAAKVPVTTETERLVRVFRVEFRENMRLAGGNGRVNVVGIAHDGRGNALWLNFGDEARAFEFLEKKLKQGLHSTVIKEMEVPEAFLKRVRASAVPEAFRREFPTSPIRSRDPFPDQYGLDGAWIDEFEAAVNRARRN